MCFNSLVKFVGPIPWTWISYWYVSNSLAGPLFEYSSNHGFPLVGAGPTDIPKRRS